MHPSVCPTVCPTATHSARQWPAASEDVRNAGSYCFGIRKHSLFLFFSNKLERLLLMGKNNFLGMKKKMAFFVGSCFPGTNEEQGYHRGSCAFRRAIELFISATVPLPTLASEKLFTSARASQTRTSSTRYTWLRTSVLSHQWDTCAHD